MPTAEKIVRVIGWDVDGCLLPEDLGSSTISQVNTAFLQALNRQGQRAAYAATFVFISSSRQSCAIDNINRRNKEVTLAEDPSSCFLPLKAMAEQELASTFCPVVLADAYSERPDGYSHTRAILRSRDATAYHPGFIVDTYKSGGLYTQAHIAANNVRGCDFVILNKKPELENFFKFSFKSNAAYIYIEADSSLRYVNKIERQEIALNITDKTRFDRLIVLTKERIQNEEHDFEMLHQTDIVQGITFTDPELNEMFALTAHQHNRKDYPIIFDVYDDRRDILADLNRIYQNKKQQALLPKNMIIRLNCYSVDSGAHATTLYVIRGTGQLDQRPKETLVKMAKLILRKEKLTEEDYEGKHPERMFSDFIANPNHENFFQERSLVTPTVTCQEDHKTYAPIERYHSILYPEDIRAISQFIGEKVAKQRTKENFYRFFRMNVANIPLDPAVEIFQEILCAKTENAILTLLNTIFTKHADTIKPGSPLYQSLRGIERYVSSEVSVEKQPAIISSQSLTP